MKKTLFLLSIISLIVFMASCYAQYRKSPSKYGDFVEFGGDITQYHLLGVNIALGNGYKSGLSSKIHIDDYKFMVYLRPNSDERKRYMNFAKNPSGPRYSFYREPGYPIFLGAIYRIFGIHPLAVKIIQTILIGFVSAMLPLIGFYYWKRTGLLAGIIASYIFNQSFGFEPWRLMTEALNLFCLTLWVITLINWEYRANNRSAFLLGIGSYLTVLVRGSNTLILICTICYILVKTKAVGNRIRIGSAFFSGVMLLLLPWSIYATSRSGEFVLVCNGHLEKLILDGNNEDTLDRGIWNPGWRKPANHLSRTHRKYEDYLYNRLKDKGYSNTEKALIFLRKYWRSIPRMAINKLRAAFNNYYGPIILCMLAFYIVYFMTREGKAPLFPLILLFTIVFNTLITFGCQRFVLVFAPFFLIPAAYAPIYICNVLSNMLPKFKTTSR